ncbi:MAG: nuclear transport factor 2 family protein [Pseudomonadota bacterium]
MTDALVTELLAMEEKVWAALEAGDADADRRLISADFLGVYPSGFAARDCHVDQLKEGPSILSHQIEDARAINLSEDKALIAYRAEFRRAPDGPAETMYVSSIWRRSGDGWINVFSQDTMAGD